MKPGSGLTNMRDRLDALGGAVRVHSAPGAGTRVEGRVPLDGVKVEEPASYVQGDWGAVALAAPA